MKKAKKTTDKKVLIIEPLEDLARILARALDRSGLDSMIATSAQEGIQLADEQTPSIVIMELIISSHNGLEFIHEFRSYPDWLDVPIIIYSQLAPSELGLDAQISREMGIAQHFYKPTTSLDELIGAVEAAF